jgi:hypothetical protein
LPKKELEFQPQLSTKEQIHDFNHGPLKVQKFVPSPQNNEGMLLSRPSFAT